MRTSSYAHRKLSRSELLRVAGAACVDHRCVLKYLRRVHDGEDLAMRSTTIELIERALADLGRHDLIDRQSSYAGTRALAPSPAAAPRVPVPLLPSIAPRRGIAK